MIREEIQSLYRKLQQYPRHTRSELVEGAELGGQEAQRGQDLKKSQILGEQARLERVMVRRWLILVTPRSGLRDLPRRSWSCGECDRSEVFVSTVCGVVLCLRLPLVWLGPRSPGFAVLQSWIEFLNGDHWCLAGLMVPAPLKIPSKGVSGYSWNSCEQCWRKIDESCDGVSVGVFHASCDWRDFNPENEGTKAIPVTDVNAISSR